MVRSSFSAYLFFSHSLSFPRSLNIMNYVHGLSLLLLPFLLMPKPLGAIPTVEQQSSKSFLQDLVDSSHIRRQHSISDCDMRTVWEHGINDRENAIIKPKDFHSLGQRYYVCSLRSHFTPAAIFYRRNTNSNFTSWPSLTEELTRVLSKPSAQIKIMIATISFAYEPANCY